MTNPNGRSQGGQNNSGKIKNTRNKSSTTDAEKLKFAMGKDQAKNHERLVKHVANAVQKKFGAPIAHTLVTEEDHQFADVNMQTLEFPVVGEDETSEAERETCNAAKQELCRINAED